MFFNSVEFAVFLPVFFVLYWFIAYEKLKLQNFLILIASYFFYGWWDWRFLVLIFFSTLVDYSVGLGIKKETDKTKRKVLLWTSILVNLGLLSCFKYYNFFLENFVSAFSLFGIAIKANSLNIILPVGISFYTFQTLSYTIDVYKQKIEPTKDFVAFSAFVSFFPQLVAGPIERATQLLPQFYKKRQFDYSKAVDGMRQILWGLFKKIVIADNCAEYANIIFNNSGQYTGSTLVLGALFFTFQIYCDFSGYSDIAIGTSRLFGFNLKKNFDFPYFSRNMVEFWRKWHISLSRWFRDYLYIPIGGSRGGLLMKIRNTFVIFIVSGFWHGANWTFIFWGALNALFFLPNLVANKNHNKLNTVAEGKYLPNSKEFLLMLSTFGLTVFGWVFFRAENIEHAFSYISGIFSYSLFSIPYVIEADTGLKILPKTIILITSLFILTEWVGRTSEYAFEKMVTNQAKLVRILIYCSLVFCTFYFSGKEQDFIYFQF